MSNAASKETLQALHAEVAKALAEAIKNPETRSAALINVARQFLKDNNIEATAVPGNDLDRLSKALTDSLPFTDPAAPFQYHN